MSWFKPSRRTSTAPRSRRPELEVLEDRTLPSVAGVITIANGAKNENVPATASSANGMSVVVWEKDVGNSDTNILAQRYDANQTKVGSTFVVAGSNVDEQAPDVAMDANGNFVVVWGRIINGESRVLYSLFDSSGGKVRTGVASEAKGEKSDAHVAMSAAGKFAISYSFADGSNFNVLAQRFKASGNPLGSPLKVAVKPDRHEFGSRIDMADNGRFAIAYLGNTVDFSNPQLRLARYAANGQLQGKHKIASVTGAARDLDVGIANSGRCVVAYDRAEPGGDSDVFVRMVSAAGVRGVPTIAAAISVESTPRLALNHLTGEFALTYRSVEGDGDHVKVREFLKNGTPKEPEHDLGAGTLNSAISLDGLDRYFLAYESIFSLFDVDLKGAFGLLS